MPKNNGLLACATEIGFIGADLGYFIGEDTTFARNPKVNEPLTSASRWLFHMAPRASGVDLPSLRYAFGSRVLCSVHMFLHELLPLSAKD
jgi:hypothetical protein